MPPRQDSENICAYVKGCQISVPPRRAESEGERRAEIERERATREETCGGLRRTGLTPMSKAPHLALVTPAAIPTPHYSIVNCAFLFCFSLSHFADFQDVANTI